MAIQNLAPAEILKVEIPTGVPWLYRLGEGLEVEEKRERALTALSS
jgi:bisphosphoglycerate-dependent phosphoglycerate mutase